MASHCSTLAGRIPQTEEPGGLQTVGAQSQTRLSTWHIGLCHAQVGVWTEIHTSSHRCGLSLVQCFSGTSRKGYVCSL